MPERVRFSDAIEPLVQFIEETPRDEILDRTLDKLRAEVPAETMLTASALAVTRSSDLPPGHHGGPLHPLAGLHAVSKLIGRLQGEQRFLPVLQHVALANKHIHDPVTGPFSLLEFAPLDAGGVEATKAAFLNSADRGESNKADHYFLWLWQHIPPIEALDLLLTVAIPKNVLDDHYFIFPAFTWRALESIGREYLPVLMRPAVRYVARFPTQRTVPEVDALIDEHHLLNRIPRQRSGEDETAAIGRIGEAIGQCDVYSEIPVLLAKALAEGLSLEGGGEALSIGAAGLFLRSLTGNPMDVHLHTSANLRRYLLRLDGLSLRNKLLILLLWHLGPEVKSTQYRMEPPPQPDPAAVAALPPRTQEALLEAITQSIYQQPPTDWSTVTNLGTMRAVPEVKETVNLAQQYVEAGYDAEALMQRLGEIVCHDSFTEMHAFKHHQAVVEEFYATREPWRWMHLVAGAQAAAISFGKNMEIYEEALDLLPPGPLLPTQVEAYKPKFHLAGLHCAPSFDTSRRFRRRTDDRGAVVRPQAGDVWTDIQVGLAVTRPMKECDMFPSPTRMFLTKGVGVHRHALAAFELALRDADIEQQNLVYVSSIFPPRCEVIPREAGVELLRPGDITFCVLARSETNEFGRHLYASLGLARPADPDMYGYISEQHGYGMTAEASGDQAEDLAATMLASTLGLDFDPDAAWNERKQIYEHSSLIIDSTSITAVAVCGPDNHWTCTIAAAVFAFS